MTYFYFHTKGKLLGYWFIHLSSSKFTKGVLSGLNYDIQNTTQKQDLWAGIITVIITTKVTYIKIKQSIIKNMITLLVDL